MSSTALAAIGLCVETVHAGWKVAAVEALVPLLSLSYEHNPPTWISSCLLFSCAVALALVAARTRAERRRWSRHWAALALIFLYISFDEIVGHGVFFFSWVIPAAVIVLVIGAAYLPFLADLPCPRRVQFAVAGALYVFGALLMELPLGGWTERAGNDNLVYAAIDQVEELLLRQLG